MGKRRFNQLYKNGKDDFYYDLYLFALNTGLGIGEIGAVKNYEIRFVYMNEAVKDILKRKLKDKAPADPIFTTKEGCRIYSASFSQRNFKPLQDRLQIRSTISFHSLRHTFASHFLMNGGSIFDLQKLLGHKSINSTMVYAHLSQSHLQDIMEHMKFH